MKKYIYVSLVSLLLITACTTDLDQSPDNIANADELSDYTGILNAAYFYQHGSVTPMAVMGDFRSDNAVMEEEPYPAFDRFNTDLTDMEDQFFGPFYTALYKSITSANIVIANSEDATQVGEAKFLRGMSYYKLVQAFGGVTVVLSPIAIEEIPNFDYSRQPVSDIYTNVIIPDLQDAIAALGTTSSDGRASSYIAQCLLGKVYVTQGDFVNAETQLAAAVSGAAGAGFSLVDDFAAIFGEANENGNSEIIYATRISSSVSDEYGFSEFWEWSGGLETKSLNPLDASLIAAFDAVAGEIVDVDAGDLRRAVTIDVDALASPKFPQAEGPDHDWIEIRLADMILLYAETLNENGTDATTVLSLLDDIRERAGLNALDPGTINTQELVRQAIADERRLELAFEGHRWFDLVRTGTVDAAMGEAVNPNYFVFPVPISEILASDGVITQNPGY